MASQKQNFSGQMEVPKHCYCLTHAYLTGDNRRAADSCAFPGNDTIVPGQQLEFVIKAPDNLMPVSTSQGVKLVSANAAFSDDEQETALAHEHRQVRLLLPHTFVHCIAYLL